MKHFDKLWPSTRDESQELAVETLFQAARLIHEAREPAEPSPTRWAMSNY